MKIKHYSKRSRRHYRLGKKPGKYLGKIAAAIGTITVLYSPYGFYKKSLPEIKINGSDPGSPVTSPFVVPISVQNNSPFTLRITSTDCRIDFVKTKVSQLIGNGELVLAQDADIDPGRELQTTCPIGQTGDGHRNVINFPSDVQIEAAHIFLRVSYKAFGINLNSPDAEFSWYTRTNPPHWVNGKIID